MTRRRSVALLVTHPEGGVVAIFPNDADAFEAENPGLEVVQRVPIFSTVEAKAWTRS